MVGVTEGVRVGAIVGAAEGLAVGLDEGVGVGANVGAVVGDVGAMVVGTEVGDCVQIRSITEAEKAAAVVPMEPLVFCGTCPKVEGLDAISSKFDTSGEVPMPKAQRTTSELLHTPWKVTSSTRRD